MSEPDDEALEWMYEQARDWWHSRWGMPQLKRRESFEYLRLGAGGLLSDLGCAFRMKGIDEAPNLFDERAYLELNRCFEAIQETVELAADIAEHEAGGGILEQTGITANDPAELFIQCLDAYEPPRVSWRLFGLSQASAAAA
jgi:hypothetical protein